MSTISYSLRALLRQPSFSISAVVILALGIGVSSAIFNLVYSVLLRPLPYAHEDRIAVLWEKSAKTGDDQFLVAPANFVDWRAQSQKFEIMAAFDSYAIGLAGPREPERVAVALVTADFFRVFGVQPSLGRSFSAMEDRPDAPAVAVLSYSLWQRLYGGSLDAIGQLLKLDREVHQVIGVMPESFRFPDDAQLWVPLKLGIEDAGLRDAHFLRVVGRLKPGVDLKRARGEMDLISGRLTEQYPSSNKDLSVNVVSLHDQVVGKVKPALLALFGAVGLVLLLACVNISTLALARALGRRQETMLRLALGASDGKIISQFLIEGLAVALCGGIVGIALANLGIRALTRLWPESIPLLDEVGVNGTLVAFTLALAVAIGLLIEFIPVLLIRRIARQGILEERGRGKIAGPAGRRSRESVVALEIALALVLLISAGLMIRSFSRLQSVSKGFDPAGLTTTSTVLPYATYGEPEQQIEFYRQTLERLAQIPGARQTAVATSVPFTGESLKMRFVIEGRTLPLSGEKPSAGYDAVSPGFFRTLGMPLVTGRDFTERDREGTAPVVIISQSTAQRYWPNENPLGRRLVVGRDKMAREIVGVVGDIKHDDLDAESQPRLYVPFAQQPWPLLTLVVRSDSRATGIPAAMRNAVWSIDREQAVSKVQTMEDVLAERMAGPRLNMFLMSVFAVIALLLATIGVYGLNAYLVAHRTYEIAIRMALGAERKDVFALFLRQGARPVLVGTIIGLFLAFFLTRILSTLLFGVDAVDTLIYVNSAFLLALISLIACFIPARKAAGSEPMLVLRQE
jgi:putative ABC transport system permease protein